jgi:hypothetical protein
MFLPQRRCRLGSQSFSSHQVAVSNALMIVVNMMTSQLKCMRCVHLGDFNSEAARRLLWEVHAATSGQRLHVVVAHLPGSDRDCPDCT